MLTLLNLIDPDRHIDRGVVLLSDTTRGYLITVKANLFGPCWMKTGPDRLLRKLLVESCVRTTWWR